MASKSSGISACPARKPGRRGVFPLILVTLTRGFPARAITNGSPWDASSLGVGPMNLVRRMRICDAGRAEAPPYGIVTTNTVPPGAGHGFKGPTPIERPSPMIPRRLVLSGAAACGIAAALPAGAADRPNPMPEELRRALERDPTAPVLGNPRGDITLSVFFDYNCPHCRKMARPIQELISSDPKLRVVYREWPVFGEGSDFAARASLASLETGKYWQFHTALLAMKDRAAEASVMRVARRVGLDPDALRRGMEAEPVDRHIRLSFQLAEHMGLMGTPTFIAGDEAVFGEQSRADLAALVARGRETLGLA